MNTNSEIKKLKKEAKKYYLAYYSISDNYDCGLSLGEHIFSDMVYYKTEFNKVMDKLEKLDSSTPKGRL